MRFSNLVLNLTLMAFFVPLSPVLALWEADKPRMPAKRPIIEVSMAPNQSLIRSLSYYVDNDHQKAVSNLPPSQPLKLETLARHTPDVRHAQPYDQRLAEALKQHLNDNKRTKNTFAKNSIGEFYLKRGFLPLWHKNGLLTAPARAVIKQLARAEYDGLGMNDYIYPWPLDIQAPATAIDDAYLIKRELTLSRLAVAYFHDARAGLTNPRDLPGDVGFRRKKFDSGRILATLSAYDKPSVILERASPATPLFNAMRRQLAMIIKAENIARAEPSKHPQIDDFYYEPVDAVNRAAQAFVHADYAVPSNDEEKRQSLYIDRRMSKVPSFDTQPMLVIPKDSMARFLKYRKSDLIATMEMARWLPDDMGDTFVFVNIPEFNVRVFENNSLIHEDRVVVGKTRFRTPIFADTMQSVVVNPYWNVPKSIMINEMLPKLQAQKALGRDYELVSPVGKVSHNVSSGLSVSTIEQGYRIRQRPGPGNALGSIKFLFPNKFAVYMHDTPAKALFDRAVRAFSHGCIRLANPWEFAEVIADLQNDFSFYDLKDVKGASKEMWFKLDRSIPVVIAYLPFYIDDNGYMREKDDIYGYLGLVRKRLGLQ